QILIRLGNHYHNVNYHWQTPDFIPKKLSEFLDSTHQEMAPSDSKDSGMAGEKIMLSVYPALNHES
ncbi:hypothetical protein, partial [Hoeflea alexandrii]